MDMKRAGVCQHAGLIFCGLSRAERVTVLRRQKQGRPKLNRQPGCGTSLARFELEIRNSHVKEEP